MPYKTGFSEVTLSLVVLPLLLGCNGEYFQPSSATSRATSFAYTANNSASAISGYSVDPVSGVLTALPDFPQTINNSNVPSLLTHDPQNRFLIVSGQAGELFVFAIDPTTGALSAVSSQLNNAHLIPAGLTIDPTGRFVYVNEATRGEVAAYSLSSAGVLTPIGTGFFPTGSFGSAYPPILPNGMQTSADGRFLYVLDVSSLYVFGIDASSGALVELQTVANPAFSLGFAIDPLGQYLYVPGVLLGSAPTNSANYVYSYSIDSQTGLLTLAHQSPMASRGSYTLAVSPNNKFAYTIENNTINVPPSLVSYSIQNGVLTPIGTAYTGVYGVQIAIDASGRFLYVPEFSEGYGTPVPNVVNEFGIGGDGTLTPLNPGTVASGANPVGITIVSQ
jgi:6-phosphogluconolactonase (cycloisomerase 2 family)